MSCMDKCPNCGNCMEEEEHVLYCPVCGISIGYPIGRHGHVEDEEEQAHERFSRWREMEGL